MSEYKPVVLCILDGWGQRDTIEGNAPLIATTPNFNNIMANGATSTLTTHGADAGLPEGQMGNSEVGHMTIGSGRIIKQDLLKLNELIKTKELIKTDSFRKLINSKNCCHIVFLHIRKKNTNYANFWSIDYFLLGTPDLIKINV